MVDEYYNEQDIEEFYQNSIDNDFSLLAAIKKFDLPSRLQPRPVSRADVASALPATNP